jgi:hypothetical protein
LIEQTTDASRTAAPLLQAHAFHRRPFTPRQHRIRGGKHLVFWHPYCHGSSPRILSLIKECYPPLFSADGNFSPMTVLNATGQWPLIDATPLDPHFLALNAQDAAAFIAAGTAANTVRSYRSALAYWSAWLQLRYGQALGDVPLPAAVAIQFVLDHLARPLADGTWVHLLPPSIDAALVAARSRADSGRWRSTRSVTAWPCWGNGTGSMSGTVRPRRRR